MNDTFYQKLHDYGTLQLIADTESDQATLQLQDGAYSLPTFATTKKDAAFIIFNNSSVQTFAEIKSVIISLRS